MVRLDARMTCWKIQLWNIDARAFQAAKEITSSASFRVHFDDLDQDDENGADNYEEYKLDFSEELVNWLSPWQEKIVGLDVCASSKLLSLHLPRLEKLKLVIFLANRQDSEQMIMKYQDNR